MSMRSSSERDSGISEHVVEEDELEVFENKLGLSRDLRFLAGMPELCDVTFLVGEERQPFYAVKAVLAIRSRVFYKLLYGPKSAGKHKIVNSLSSGGTVSKRIQKLVANSPLPVRNIFPTHVPSSSAIGNSQKTIVTIDDFEPDVFKQLLEFIHTGSVTLQPKTLLGLMNAADHFALEDLRKACAEFSHRCIKTDTVCALLVTAERYIQYKSTKIFVQRVLEFVDSHGEEVLRLSEFVHLPRHVVELVLSREDLQAAELTKLRATERWSRHYVLYHPLESMADAMKPFVQYIAFAEIPTSILINDIRPLGIVPDVILMAALAHQADPSSLANSKDLLTPRIKCRSGNNTLSLGRNSNSIARSCSVDRNLSKCSTGTTSSGYESSGCLDEGVEPVESTKWSPRMRTVVRVEPLDEKTKSFTDLSTIRIEYKL